MNTRNPSLRTARRLLSLSTLIWVGGVAQAGGQEPDPPATTRIGISYENSSFSGAGGLRPWHELRLELSQSTEYGSVQTRVNMAERFDRRAAQLEIDAYPGLGDGRYAFVNVGFSGDELYPSFRGSIEIWQSLPGSLEISAGFRHLRFSEAVWLYTGSVAHYMGNYWIAVRPWFRSKHGEVSGSGQLFVRKYGRDRDDYIGILLGAGSGIGDFDTADELDRLHSFRAGFDVRKPLSSPWFLKLGASADWEEITSDRDRSRFKVGIGLERGIGLPW